jgi:hypothetical protein
MATLKPQTPEAPPPSAETIQLAQATTEEVDAELVEIFLDEADEVLARTHENLRQLHEQPHDVESADCHPSFRAHPQGQRPDGRAQGFRRSGVVD